MSGRARALAGLAVVVAGGLAAGSGYALHQVTKDDSSPAAAARPQPSATSEPTSEPTPEPTTAASPTPAPAPSPTTSPTPSGSPSARPTATVKRYAYPAPTRTYTALYFASAKAMPTNDAAHDLDVEARATDGDGTVFLTSIDWGDGTTSGGEKDPASCPAYPSPTAQPAPYRPHPDDRTLAASHRYARAGTYTVKILVRSINADCRPHGPKQETALATLPDIVVA